MDPDDRKYSAVGCTAEYQRRCSERQKTDVILIEKFGDIINEKSASGIIIMLRYFNLIGDTPLTLACASEVIPHTSTVNHKSLIS